MPRIYAPNEDHNTEYGADFVNGVAAVAYDDANLLAYFDGKGYTEVQGGDVLQAFDYLTRTDLDRIAASMSIDTSEMEKYEVIQAIETALITIIGIAITEFDAIADIDGGTLAEPTYADATEVIAALPEYVTATVDDVKVSVPVTAWVDTDTYSAAAAASYTFTATLGSVPTPYTTSATATVEVVVSAS